MEPQHGFTKWFSVPLGHSPYIDPPLIENNTVYPGKGFVTDLIIDKSIEYIKELAAKAKKGDNPFYISVHYTAPHSPWGKLTQPSTWYEYYANCIFDSVPFEPIHKNAIFTCESPYFASGAEATEVETLRKELLSGYFGAIAAMDEGVGKIMRELEEQGIMDDTIIVFTSDNGMNTGHHGIWRKGNGTYPQNMYDTSVKIPFILLKIPECCTYFNADILEELVLTRINKELMVRGEAAEQEKNLHMFQKSRIAETKKKLEALYHDKKQVQDSKVALYESYVDGGMAAEEYRKEADRLDQQIVLLDQQIHGGGEELLKLEAEYEKLEEDMEQVIRYSHMEKLTQELVDVFIKRIYVYKDKRV